MPDVVVLGTVLLHHHHPNDVAFHALFFAFSIVKAVVSIKRVRYMIMFLNFQTDGAGSRECADACLQELATDSVVLVVGVNIQTSEHNRIVGQLSHGDEADDRAIAGLGNTKECMGMLDFCC